MNYVERAKALLKSATLQTALVIVPLALAVPQAQAAAILPTGSVTCIASGDGSSGAICSGGVAQLPELNGVQGVKLFTTLPGTFTAGVSGALSSDLDLSYTGTTSGTTSFLADSTIPLSLIANLSASGASIDNYFATYSIEQDLGEGTQQIFFGFISGNGGGTGVGGTGIGSFFGDLASGSNVIVTVHLNVGWTALNSSAILSVGIPQNSADFNPVATSVPEPASMALVALGLAGGVFYSRRKR